MRQCQCGGPIREHELTGQRSAWTCAACGRYQTIDRAQQTAAAALTDEQKLAADRALNAAKATPAYFAPSDLFSLSQQNRGAL